MNCKEVETIVKIKFGSHLYGTATPASDVDIKGVYIPSARDILLQRVKPIISFNRLKDHGEKNTTEDVDYELYSPEKFLTLLAEGQAMALEMLFAPKSLMLSEPHPLWLEIQALAPKLFTKQASCFVRYCKQQANKYGIKGSRVAATRIALEYLSMAEEEYGSKEKLLFIEDSLKKLTDKNEFLAVGEYIDSNNR
ncbi:MAG TPA: nucleotidyltransferase domain-containing protein, partial [Alphaproteobacteria bacterium]|nr:nucleotidyltransferase domain-containing protein [Alphaproteobacteria bacterium]